MRIFATRRIPEPGLELLRKTGEVEIEVALGSGVTTPAWCAGHRAFGGGVPAGCDPVLIVDARAWLAPGLLEALIGIVRARDTFVRVQESSTDQNRSSGQARTLAAAFPARIFPDAVARGLTRIDRMLTWKWVDAAIRVEASDLQAAEPSRLLESLVELAVVEVR